MIPEDIRANLVKMKVQDPGMKFRCEKNAGCFEKVVTQQSHTQGLEAHNMFFVELDVYKKKHGDPDQRDVVFDYLPNGSKVSGVYVQPEESKGWWRRIDSRTASVKRTAELTEENIDPSGAAMERIEQAAKKTVLRDVRPMMIDEPVVKSSTAMSSNQPASQSDGINCLVSCEQSIDVLTI